MAVCCVPWTRAFTAGLVGVLICIGGILFNSIFLPKIIQSRIGEKLKILPDTPTFKAWSEPTVPIYIQFWFYNTTNHVDVMKGKKPIFQEVGPYTYRQYRKKVNISWNEDESQVTYEQTKHYVYQPDLSGALLNATIITLNLPYASLANKAQYMPPKQKSGLDFMIIVYKPQLFVKKTAEEFMFKGYYDKFIDTLQKAKKQETLKNATFGFLYNKNGTNDGVYSVNTGKFDHRKFARVESWNNLTELPWWRDSYCNMINGSDGSMFPPFMDRSATLRMYSTDLCRSIYLEYNTDTEVQGIPTYRFTPPFSLLANNSENPDNLGYCMTDKVEDCPGSGILNVSTCRKGAPILVSLAHFLDGEPEYAEDAGVNPARQLDQTFLDIEPNTGLMLRAMRRMQVNVPLKRYPTISGFDKVPTMYYPIFWLNESAAMTAERAEIFKEKVLKSINLGKTMAMALIGIGIFFLICAVAYGGYILYSQKRQKDYGVENGKVHGKLATPMDKHDGTTKGLLNNTGNTKV